MISRFYLPILKSKQGEFDALALLPPTVKSHVVPLIEITKLEYDHAENAKPKTIESHLDSVCKRIYSKWGNSFAFIDTFLINDTSPGGMSCVDYLYTRFLQWNFYPLPVIQMATPHKILDLVKEKIFNYNISEVGLRVFIEDITSPSFVGDVEELLERLEVNSEKCHIILDLGSADFSNNEDFSDGIIYYLQSFPLFQEWKSFTIAGGAFPPTNFLKVGVNEIPRGEWLFYKTIINKLEIEGLKRKVNYGDYGVVSPGHFEFDPTKMDRSANIRYTHDGIWYVIKGKSLKISGHDQYFDLATKVKNSDYYMGENFSAGDLHISNCSQKKTTTGNPTVWNKVGFNHHFSKVIADLSSNYLFV